MRIDGVVDEYGRPYIPVYVVIPSIGVADVIPFLVDTGADRTVMTSSDARDLGIRYDSLQSGKRAIGVGETSTKEFREDIYLIFRTDSNPHQERLDGVDILLVKRVVPSLLGRDLLQKFRLTLTKGEVYLER